MVMFIHLKLEKTENPYDPAMQAIYVHKWSHEKLEVIGDWKDN